ncbi:MAG: nucleotidyltransferase family protein [Erysipelotrichaceae bacterium]|nr:nucleotidyltransferase family protein [Erysipelotrichaceae bacterium]
MKCIIVAAGYATRLYPLTENFPKPLLEVKGKPILDWLIEDIDDQIEEFIVVTNHKFYEHFLKWAQGKKVRVVDDGTSSNETRLGAVRDIRLAAEDVECDCLVMAGDNLLDFSLRGFVDYALDKDTSCVMCHEENELKALQKTAVITMDENDLITSYEEKPQIPKGNHAVPPFYFYKLEDLKRIDEALVDGCAYDAPGSFAAWLSRKVPMHAYRMPGRRYDIGDLESYRKVNEMELKKGS